MSYLISQMVFSLLMAGIAGAAFGWLLHRARSASKLDELHQIVSDQDRRLTQSDSEIRMLSDDFEDLRQRSRTEIDVLKQENRQLPQLTQNLEKSQLLVRQLMQKHEAQLRSVSGENESLKERLSTLTDREQLNRKLQSELEALRPHSGESEPAASDVPTSTVAETESDSDDATFDDPIDLAEPAAIAPEPVERKDAAVASRPGVSSVADEANSTGSSWASVKLSSTDDVDPLDHVIEIDDELHAEISDETNLGDDDTLNDSPLFDPVDQHDDLKQIYGIGEITEKSLNQLGITSYGQLAELERHDIATIAEALEIVPGRIERDDWVGSARRQLEDVLEEL